MQFITVDIGLTLHRWWI